MTSFPRRAAALLVAAVATAPALAAPAHASAGSAEIRSTRWSSTTQLDRGTSKGLSSASHQLRITSPTGTLTNGSRSYEYGVWESPWTSTGFGIRSVLASWNAKVPSGSLVRVEVRGRTSTTVGSWDRIATWGESSGGSVTRTSSSSQTDDLTKVATDTVITNGSTRLSAYQVRVFLARPTSWSSGGPTVQSVSAVASGFTTRTKSTSSTSMTRTQELAVPRYSQMIHEGEFPQWGGGGEAWCSPTSTSMVVRYFGTGPSSSDYAFAKRYANPWVDHAARDTYDAAYGGTGNWPFNTAYAGRYGLDAFVTRMADLRDAEAFVKKGLPVVVSVAFGKGELDGAPISSTDGHLLVVTGFTGSGRPIVNDPAGSSSSNVRRAYSRAQLERAWLNGSGGVAYVIHPTSKPLPTSPGRW